MRTSVSSSPGCTAVVKRPRKKSSASTTREPLLLRSIPKAIALSKFPSVRRDLAFVVAEQVPWASIAASVEAAAGPSLKQLRLFDRYAGKGVERGFKSLAMGLILQDDSRTLTDRDVDAVVADVTAALQRDHSARIRE